jgi:acetyltransferase
MAVALMDWAIGNQVGFSKLISLGNKAVMSGNSILTLLENDPDTDVIVVYLESIKDGRSLFDLSKHITKKKPIIMVKSGLSTR